MGTELHDLSIEPSKAILVGLVTLKQNAAKAKEYLDELAFLTQTLGIIPVKSFTQKLDRPDSATFVGKGKLEEVQEAARALGAEYVIFDDDLTPSQAKNIEKVLDLKLLDRSLLILDIFLQRAQTAQARTQVELARNQYLLPRLTGMWTHLERQRGGTGTRGGAGEKEIETDRRVIRDSITLLKEKLEKIDRQRATQRKSRATEVRVALVGYTNVGKSTLMNQLTKANVFAENKLFATIDSTVRKVVFDEIPFLLTDTVGFIRKLPHQLIECFKSTLDEVRDADILLHVVDVAHVGYEEQMEVVKSTLAEIGAVGKPTLTIFNKTDLLLSMGKVEDLKGLELHYADTETEQYVCISAEKRDNIELLRNKLTDLVKARYFQIYPNYLKERWDAQLDENAENSI